MITFVHIRDTANTGDMASCPAEYFDFGPDIAVLNYSDPVPDGGAVIYGGGTMVNWLNNRPALPDATRIIWGAGSSRHGETEPWPDPAGFDLIGTREWTPEREKAGLWAPCPSCMSPLFDRDYQITREAVAFVNASDSIRSRYPAAYGTGLPTMDNSAPMSKVVAFLGSAETVVTNSYHAVFWATLLGRRVVCVPYSSKFHGLRFPPAYSHHGADWRQKIMGDGALIYPEALGVCRQATRAFHARVMDLIGERAAA